MFYLFISPSGAFFSFLEAPVTRNTGEMVIQLPASLYVCVQCMQFSPSCSCHASSPMLAQMNIDTMASRTVSVLSSHMSWTKHCIMLTQVLAMVSKQCTTLKQQTPLRVYESTRTKTMELAMLEWERCYMNQNTNRKSCILLPWQHFSIIVKWGPLLCPLSKTHTQRIGDIFCFRLDIWT